MIWLCKLCSSEIISKQQIFTHMHEPHMDIHVNAVLYVSFYLFSQGIYGIAGAQCAAQTGQVSARRVRDECSGRHSSPIWTRLSYILNVIL